MFEPVTRHRGQFIGLFVLCLCCASAVWELSSESQIPSHLSLAVPSNEFWTNPWLLNTAVCMGNINSSSDKIHQKHQIGILNIWMCSFLQEEVLWPGSFSLGTLCLDLGVVQIFPQTFPIKLEWGWQGAALLCSLPSWHALSCGQSFECSEIQIAKGCSHPGSCWVPLSPFPQSCHQSHWGLGLQQGIIHLLCFPGCPAGQDFIASQQLFLLWVGFEVIIVLRGLRKGFADSLLGDFFWNGQTLCGQRCSRVFISEHRNSSI